MHLLLLPVVFSVAGACCYGLVGAACAFAAAFRDDVRHFSNYQETTKILIVIPMLLASFPVGFLATNLLAWIIPPARRFFNREAQGRPKGDFASSMRGLLTFAKYWMPPLIAIGCGVAFFGK
jgi:hypothetical protein